MNWQQELVTAIIAFMLAIAMWKFMVYVWFQFQRAIVIELAEEIKRTGI